MTDPVRPRPWAIRLAVAAAVFVSALGLVVQAGWISRTPALVQLLPHLPPMTRNTAACLLLCGIALGTLALGGRRRVAATCAGVAGAVGAVTFAQFAFGINVGIDEILGTSYINVGLPRRGRMAPGSAICFALAGTALLVASRGLTRRSALLLGLNGSIVVAFGTAATLGFWGGVTLTALPTAVGLGVLGIGILALAWRVEGDPAGTPPWLPISVAIGVLAGTAGLWRALVLGGYAPFDLLPAAVIAGGSLIAPVFGLTVYLAQRGQAQAAALRRSEALLAEAQRLSRTGSFAWRVAADVVTYSEETYRTYEFDPARPVTLAMIATRIHPDDLPLLREMIDRARGDGSGLDYEYRLRMPDGRVKHLHLVARATRDPEGGLEYIGAIQDVTQRRLSEEALGKVRSELAHVARVTTLGALTASIAHEVNQPLSGIVTNASTCLRMLAADPPDVQGALETARRTIRDGHRASDVITRLRALFGRQTPTTGPVDLNEATREVIALSSSELRRKRVILRAELDDDLPAVTGDRVQLQQVIVNLFLNASEAMSGVDDRPRELVVRTARDEGDRVLLSVRDAGVGFDPGGAERLFEAFHTTKPEGMGIGLSLSRSIIESHHGRLWAVPNDGPGATFLFSIPRDRTVPRRVALGDPAPDRLP